MRLLILMLIFFLFECRFAESKKSEEKERSNINPGSSIVRHPIAYKSEIYKLFLGQTRDSIEKIIDISRMIERDNSINDADSIKHYMNISEALISLEYGGTGECLPALYFTFRREILTEFECSIVLNPSERTEKKFKLILKDLEPGFFSMRDKLKDMLSKKLYVELTDGKWKESFQIDTTNKPDMFFVYRLETR